MKGSLSPVRRVAVAIVAVCAAIGAGSVVFAHDDIDSSVPEHQSQFDDPISEVLIDFGDPVGGVELALVGPDNGDLPGTVEVISDTEAKLLFEPLSTKGEYLVRYLAEEDGHLIGGAISFVYGERAGTGANMVTWGLFGLAAALILAIGAFFSLKRARQANADHDESTPVSV
jgi:methionine-rich copper-binding protein CopC